VETIAAADLPARLLAAPMAQGAVVDVSPPDDWDRALPRVMRALEALRGRRWPVPALRGLPACLVSIQDRPLLAPVPGGRGLLPVCAACDLCDRCASPAREMSAMQACSTAPMAERWDRFHAGLARVIDVERDPRVDAAAGHLLSLCAGPLASRRVDLEPSVVLGERLEPAVRFVCFYGEASSPDEGRAAGVRLWEAWRELHDLVGLDVPARLATWLAERPELPLHLGLEAKAGGRPEVRGYVTLESLDLASKRTLLEGLVPAEARPAWFGDDVLEATQMLGFTTGESGFTTLKAYVRRDPSSRWDGPGLAALAANHPAHDAGGGRAYAVVDLVAGEPRAHKWDVRLRDRLVTGGNAAGVLGPCLSAGARADLARLVAATGLRLEVSNAGFRGARTALYVWLG
jgi:hypothetical protein